MSGRPRNPFSLHGKTVLVTGASSGIGRQVAISSAQRGALLLITGRDPQRLQATFDALPGPGHRQHLADLTDAAQRRALAAASGPIDGLVHCAGQQRLCPIRQLTEHAMTQMYETNFLAPVMLTQQLLQANALAAGGSIIFMLSIAAHIGTRGVGPYSAMKSALLGVIRCLALEQARRGVRVNGISPSAVVTQLWSPSQLEEQRARHPLGLGTPQDVAHGAVYLLADASRWVTGTTLVMDGGCIL